MFSSLFRARTRSSFSAEAFLLAGLQLQLLLLLLRPLRLSAPCPALWAGNGGVAAEGFSLEIGVRASVGLPSGRSVSTSNGVNISLKKKKIGGRA